MAIAEDAAEKDGRIFVENAPKSRKSIVVGFTGTSEGMTTRQHAIVKDILRRLNVDEIHHGDCIGSDAEVARIAQELGITIVSHPPNNPKFRANSPANFVLNPEPFLTRNKSIVRVSEILLATPRSSVEELRSGTWSTIRYGLNTNFCKRIVIIRPDYDSVLGKDIENGHYINPKDWNDVTDLTRRLEQKKWII